jgi:hypothetical protein
VKDRDIVAVLSIFFEHPVFPAPYVEEAIFSPTYVFGTFVENQMAVAV